MFLCSPCVILWAQPCFFLERVRKIDRSSNVDQEQVRKVSPVWLRIITIHLCTHWKDLTNLLLVNCQFYVPARVKKHGCAHKITQGKHKNIQVSVTTRWVDVQKTVVAQNVWVVGAYFCYVPLVVCYLLKTFNPTNFRQRLRFLNNQHTGVSEKLF